MDALRAAAILLVVLRHGISTPGLDEPEPLLWRMAYRVANNGWLGVDLFFVLSGYLIGRQILRELAITGGLNWRRFLLRRALRTLPAYYFVLILLWAGAFGDVLQTQGVRDPQALIAHVFFVNDYVQPPILVTFWSLATEEKFYLLMIVAMPLLAGVPRLAAASAVICATCISLTRVLAYYASPPENYAEFFWEMRAPLHFALEGLLLGVCVALLRHSWIVPERVAKVATNIGIAVACLVLVGNGWHADGETSGALLAIPLFSVASALIVFGSVDPPRPRTVAFLAKPIVWLANISFSLYLGHYLVAKGFISVVPHAAVAHPMLYWGIYLLGSLSIGYLLHAGVERPGLRLRDRLLRQAKGEASPPTAQDQLIR